MQAPLSDAWFDSPAVPDSVYVRAADPDFREWLDAGTARRMGRLLKRAMVTSRAAVRRSGIAMPDAIISGTGLGCIESTGIFLEAMIRNGEELLQPTHFMQSTHNTIGSLIGIDLGCHGCNSTYAHKGISFESALLDAFQQMGLGRIRTALVGGYDEMTPDYHLLLSRIEYWRRDDGTHDLRHGHEAFSGETSVSFMLSSGKSEKTVCAVGGVEIAYGRHPGELSAVLGGMLARAGITAGEVDAVITGMNGNGAVDDVYRQTAAELFPGKRLVRYKHIFGESYTATALGMYAAATCLSKSRIPAHMAADGGGGIDNPRAIVVYNRSGNADSLILLQAV